MGNCVKYFFILLIIAPCFSAIGQVNIRQVYNLIYSGQAELANKKIESYLSKSISIEDRISLITIQGEICKIEGNIEKALIYWKESNSLRLSNYSKSDYHLAWNYALLSNYHYEKINTDLAVKYADSCMVLIKNLTTSQQKEIEIYKIWNILAQSYKQKQEGLSVESLKRTYANCRTYYTNSIAFITANHINKEELAITYRLLGNSYLDMLFVDVNNISALRLNYDLANEFYNKSIAIWNDLYGDEHMEFSKTLFVKGLLNFYINDTIMPMTNTLAIENFEKALVSYGVVELSPISTSSVFNKEDLLMTCSYLTKAYFIEYQKKAQIELLNSAKKINSIAIEVWTDIHESFNGPNTNQNLSIYSLVPFSESITIELFKKQAGLDYSLNTIFKANQKLKYYDLLKYGRNGNTVSAEINIKDLQKKLKSGEVFLDFHISLITQSIVVLRITNQSHELIELPNLKNGLLEQYLKSIETIDFDAYIKSAHKIYQAIIEPCKVGQNNLILCLDGWLNSIPFEALLTTKNNWNKKDYRQLDYMLLQNKIQYVLNPQLFRNNSQTPLGFQIEAFIPNNSTFSSLPFSEQLGEQLQSKFTTQVHSLTGATKRNFLNMNSPIVHLSGHGVISNEDMMNSFLVFSDSLLYLDDLVNLRNVPALMVLNTCNSSNGKIYYGEGVNGFVRTLNMFGVKSVISNLWEVDDQASNQILERFYRLLSEGKSTTEALYLAQIDRIQQAQSSNMAAPYYWAGHKMVGGEIVFEKSKQSPNNLQLLWLLFGAGALISIGYLLIRNRNKR